VTEDEYIVLMFLKSSPETWFARREIARRAVKRKIFEENAHWADVPLASLVGRGEIEHKDGLYRLKSANVDYL
jgi:hypothetical protein